MVPDKLKPYFSDYKINVFEIAWLTEEHISRFTSDFKVIANFFVKKRIDPNYVPDDLTEIRHVDEVLKLIAALSGDNRYISVISNKKRKVKNMCEVADRLVNKGIEKGIEQRDRELAGMMLKDGKTPNEIHNFTHIPLNLIEKVQKEMLQRV